MLKNILFDLNANPIAHLIQIKNGIMKHVIVNIKIIIGAKKIIAGVPSRVFVKKANIENILLMIQ